MHNLRDRRLKAEIATVAVDADVIGEALRMTPKAERVIGLIKIARAEDEFGLIVAFETGAGYHVEHTVGSIAKLGPVAAAIHFHVINIFGIKLRADIGSDVRVGPGHAIDEPCCLMSAADVQLVVRNVSPRHVICNHCQTVAPVSPWRPLNFTLTDERGWSSAVSSDDVRRSRDANLFVCQSQLQLKM